MAMLVTAAAALQTGLTLDDQLGHLRQWPYNIMYMVQPTRSAENLELNLQLRMSSQASSLGADQACSSQEKVGCGKVSITICRMALSFVMHSGLIGSKPEAGSQFQMPKE